jgi:hypothetical protein
MKNQLNPSIEANDNMTPTRKSEDQNQPKRQINEPRLSENLLFNLLTNKEAA